MPAFELQGGSPTLSEVAALQLLIIPELLVDIAPHFAGDMSRAHSSRVAGYI